MAGDARERPGARAPAASAPTDGSVRKQQITIRLDPGMIEDAREIAARKGIGHHTLLRMWVMEGITRAYDEGLLDGRPRSWAPRASPAVAAAPTTALTPAPPAGARWTRRTRRDPTSG
jgi:hypothetical protein